MTTRSARILALDQGNTRGKATLFAGGEPVESIVASPRFSLDDVVPLLGDIDGAVYCSVGVPDPGFVDALWREAGCRVLILSHDTPLPMAVEYATPSTLGLDRIAAAAGAVAAMPGMAAVVADAGTALTIDVVSAGGAFLGGNISAGVSMRLQSLHSHTARLPLVEAAGELPRMGCDTVTAMRCGAVRGAAAEISAMARLVRKECGDCRIMLTGGDAPLLAPLVEAPASHVCVDTELVGRGLISIFEYNDNDE